jgi:hypothetical protein
MLLKTATSLAFATACLTAVATMPGHAQTAGAGGSAAGYPGGQTNPGAQTYQGSTAPNWSQGNPGSTSGSYAPQANQGNYGAGSANYAPQSNQGNMTSSPTGMGGTEVMTNGPQGSSPPNWSAQQNVRQSERYDRLLETNRGFRQARMRRECGPITDADLHQQCLASFHQDEPYSGSSSPRRHTRSEMGR